MVAECGSQRGRIEARYRELLERAGSPLTGDAGVMVQVMSQLHTILDEVYAVLGIEPEVAAPVPEFEVSVDIGRSRAGSGTHPAHSLRAAGLIFDAALPGVVEDAAGHGVAEPKIAAALALNRAIMVRMSIASTSYLGFMVEKVHAISGDERRRWSRDLHDVITPAISVGIQDLDLALLYGSSDPQRSLDKVIAAREALLDALRTIRSVAAESRDEVGSLGLDHAISAVLDNCDPAIRTDLRVDGDLTVLPQVYQEEVFLVVREAIRNAVRHARPTTITVDLTVAGYDVTATVTDDGIGFDPTAGHTSRRTLGLTSMRERAELLGGTLSVASRPDSGSTVALRVACPPPTPKEAP